MYVLPQFCGIQSTCGGYMKSTSCKRCHRPLTNPRSIERGYGPVCAKKLGIAIRNKSSFSILTEEYKELKLPTLEEYFAGTSGSKNLS